MIICSIITPRQTYKRFNSHRRVLPYKTIGAVAHTVGALREPLLYPFSHSIHHTWQQSSLSGCGPTGSPGSVSPPHGKPQH